MDKKVIKRPQTMNIPVMRKFLEQMHADTKGKFFLSRNFGVSAASNSLFREVLQRNWRIPYIVEDYRVGLIVKGELDVTLNLIHRHAKAGDIAFVGRGSIAELHNVSDDLEVRGLIISDELMQKVMATDSPYIMSGAVQGFTLTCSAEESMFFRQIAELAYTVAQSDDISEKVIGGLISSAVNYINDLYLKSNNQGEQNVESNRQRDIFNRFIALVNEHASTERNMSFYANKLCLSPRYLSTLITEQSGKTGKQWIDQAVISQAKVLLKHSTLTVSQISDRLAFPNDSFFCKYFRRLTGLSPSSYREG